MLAYTGQGVRALGGCRTGSALTGQGGEAKKASRGLEPRSLDSESRVLTVTPRGQLTVVPAQQTTLCSKKAAFCERGGLQQDASWQEAETKGQDKRAHPDLNQGPADLQSAALTTELCTHLNGPHAGLS